MTAWTFKTKLERIAFIIFSLALGSNLLSAQTIDDKVIITHRSDVYTFFEKDGQLKVRHDIKEDYKLNSSIDQKVYPAITYTTDGMITLKSASCPGSKAQYKNINPDGIFHDDTQLCYFVTTLTPRIPTRTVRFTRIINDAHYLTRIDLGCNHLTQEHTLSMVFPKDTTPLRLVPMNMTKDTQVDTIVTNEGITITYTLHHCKPIPEEKMTPPYQHIAPQLLVTGIFSDYHELYKWQSRFAVADTVIPSLSSMLQEINRDSHNDMDRLRNTYQWVQRNIRYIAFEAGNACLQPDSPAEVLRKRYGDCKGMATLLCTLLRAQGFDARRTSIGTTDIPYHISQYPTLSAANHEICTVFHQGRTYFLDATLRHIPLDYVPQHIQGKDAMVEDGDDCLMLDVPVLPASTSIDSLYYQYELAPEGQLSGEYARTFSGELEELFQRTNPNDTTIRAGAIDTKDVVLKVDDELYLDMNPHKDTYAYKVDTLKRHNDVWLPLRLRMVREVHLHLPQTYMVSYLPHDIDLTIEQGRLSCTFRQEGDTIIYKQSLQVNNQYVPINQFSAWNKAIDRWHETCNEQIILKRKTA